jgi:hypothetical protein
MDDNFGRDRSQNSTGEIALPLLWYEEIEPVLDVQDFVQGLLTTASSIVVYGPSNCGKTFWSLDLALHVAAGWKWNGRRVDQRGVIYCVLEGGIGFRNRVAAWKEKTGLDDQTLPFAVVPVQLNLLDPAADTDRLIAAIQLAAERIGIPVGLVIIDTLARALAGGNENGPEDMGLLVANMDRIRAKTDAAIMFIHHSGKDQAKGARGHSSLQAAIDTEIEIAHDAIAKRHTATVVKQRDLAKGDVFRFTLRAVELGCNRFGEPVTTCVVDASEASAAATQTGGHGFLSVQKMRALEVLTDLIATEGETGRLGLPDQVASVSGSRWREEFYDRTMPGSDAEAQRKAFSRASNELIHLHIVGMASKRVWLVKRNEGQGNVP